jgi:hypothetical protein
MRGGYQGERRRAVVRRTAVTAGGSGYSRRAVLAAGADVTYNQNNWVLVGA